MLRYSRGDALNGFAVTAMGYRGELGFDRSESRARASTTAHRSVRRDRRHRWRRVVPLQRSFEWQRTRNNASTKLTAFGIALRAESVLELHLLPRRSGERRSVPPGRSPLRTGGQESATGGWAAGRAAPMQNTVGVQLRNDNIAQRRPVSHRRRGSRSTTSAQDAVIQTSVGGYAQNEIAVDALAADAGWLRASTAIASTSTRANRRTPARDYAALVSPKGGAVFGPWSGTEF